MNADTSMTELSGLTVLPSLLDGSGSNTVPPMILAIKSGLPSHVSFGDKQSVIDRWEAVEQRETLHPAFEQLVSRRNSVSGNDLPMVTKLRKLDPILFNKIIIRVQTMQFGRVIILNFSDGSVEYRDRFTFDEIYASQDLEQIMHLRQVGWTFPEGLACWYSLSKDDNLILTS
jgi:mediator of RNA polymerase II transcription subunit 16, fungi type